MICKDKNKHIERTAYLIYRNRCFIKKSGNAESDWELADKINQNPLRKLLFAMHCSFISVEKSLWEPLLDWVNNQALLSLVGLIGNIGVVVAVTIYIGSEKQRREGEILNAWQTITSAYGQAGSGGRMQALEFLNASPGANWRRRFPWVCAPHPMCMWPAEDLSGINIQVKQVDENLSSYIPYFFADEEISGDEIDSDYIKEMIEKFSLDQDLLDLMNERILFIGSNGAYLQGIQLPKAILINSNFGRANLLGANLEGANLRNSILEQSVLTLANLKDSNLSMANLNGSGILRANLANSNLRRASFEGALIVSPNMENVDLFRSNFKRATIFKISLIGINLSGSILEEVELFWVDFTKANLYLARLQKAKLYGGIFKKASFLKADLKESYITDANFAGANLEEANLTSSDLINVDLEDANLKNTIFVSSRMINVNLAGAENLTIQQLDQISFCRILPPAYLEIDPYRDCSKMGLDPKKGEYLSTNE